MSDRSRIAEAPVWKGGAAAEGRPYAGRKMIESVDWGERAQRGYLASGIDPADRLGRKNRYIDFLQKKALSEVLNLRGDEVVLDFGCGSGRISYWIAPKVRRVIGLEVTPEMIELGEKHRAASNVEFVLYNGIDFPSFPYLFDLILSVGVLQIMRGEALKRAVSGLTRYLRPGGRFCLIEQASDDPNAGRPKVDEYLEAFEASGLECLQFRSVRRGRFWFLYLIRYGLIPERWFSKIATWELNEGKRFARQISYYRDFLFLLRRP